MTKTNPKCPDHSSHTQNVFEQRYPNREPELVSPDGWATIDELAQREYIACEGHV